MVNRIPVWMRVQSQAEYSGKLGLLGGRVNARRRILGKQDLVVADDGQRRISNEGREDPFVLRERNAQDLTRAGSRMRMKDTILRWMAAFQAQNRWQPRSEGESRRIKTQGTLYE